MKINDASRHPEPEVWAGYLYDELAPEARGQVETHLSGCAECRARLEEWRHTQATLDQWKVRARTRRVPVLADAARWAAAAAVVLGLGWMGGRLAVPAAPDVDRLRAEVQPVVEQQLRREFAERLETELAAVEQRHQDRLVELAQSWATARAEDQQAVLALHQRAERQHASDYTRLRRDLETVALVAEGAIGDTRQQLTQLAVNTRAASAGGGGEPR